VWQPAHAAQGAHQAGVPSLNIWGFLHTHKTAMVGNVLTTPVWKEMDPRRGAISYDQITRYYSVTVLGETFVTVVTSNLFVVCRRSGDRRAAAFKDFISLSPAATQTRGHGIPL
jgi:hypothetical protein